MRKLLPIVFCLILLGCSKKNDPLVGVKETLHVTISSDDPAQKFVDIHANDTPRQYFTTGNFDNDISTVSGTSIAISSGYSVTSTHSVHIIVTKNGNVISDQSAMQRVDVTLIAP